jgi:hypothetical protein
MIASITAPKIPAAPAPAATPAPLPIPGQTHAPAPAPAPTTPKPSAPGAPANPSGPQTPADAAAQKAAMLDKLMKTTAVEAITQVGGNLKALSQLTVGGGTPEGQKAAQTATALLTDSSMMLQQADLKAVLQLHDAAAELHARLMGSATSLAFLAGQLAIAGQSKQPIKVADVAKDNIAQAVATMQATLTALTPPKDGAPASAPGPTTTPAPAPAAPPA